MIERNDYYRCLHHNLLLFPGNKMGWLGACLANLLSEATGQVDVPVAPMVRVQVGISLEALTSKKN